MGRQGDLRYYGIAGAGGDALLHVLPSPYSETVLAQQNFVPWTKDQIHFMRGTMHNIKRYQVTDVKGPQADRTHRE